MAKTNVQEEVEDSFKTLVLQIIKSFGRYEAEMRKLNAELREGLLNDLSAFFPESDTEELGSIPEDPGDAT